MAMRPYNHKKDRKAVHRVLKEINWMPADDAYAEAAQDAFSTSARAFVSDLNGAPECFVTTMPGTVQYQEETVSLCCVTGVCTSRVARKQGLAAGLTAHAVAQCAASGAELAGLGCFEQGFYDRFGFGMGIHEFLVRFDPADLTVDLKPRVPVRIAKEDWKDIHDARLRSLRRHGSATVLPPAFTRLRTSKPKGGFGLGYRDRKGRITHHFWGLKGEGYSPTYDVFWFSYETYEQLIELFALLKAFGDEIRTISVPQPPHVQVQDLISHPFRSQNARENSKHYTGTRANAYWQLRINDLAACLAKTHLRSKPMSFNLSLTDPIAQFLAKGERWKGADGDYVVTLGGESSAKRGTKAALPRLAATVNAFTRMWLGVQPATTLAITDRLSGDAKLLAKLDNALVLPKPHLGWFF
jgi:predicted acetyltransferase